MSQEKKERNSKKFKPGNKEKWSERVVQISRVTKVCKGGKKLSFRAVVVIGNEMGQVGVGVGKADDVINAITKGISNKNNLIYVELTKTKTICIAYFCMSNSVFLVTRNWSNCRKFDPNSLRIGWN